MIGKQIAFLSKETAGPPDKILAGMRVNNAAVGLVVYKAS